MLDTEKSAYLIGPLVREPAGLSLSQEGSRNQNWGHMLTLVNELQQVGGWYQCLFPDLKEKLGIGSFFYVWMACGKMRQVSRRASQQNRASMSIMRQLLLTGIRPYIIQVLVKNWKESYRIIKEMPFEKLPHSHNGCITGLFERSCISSYQTGLQGGSSLESLWQALVVTAFSFAMCLLRNWVSAHFLSISSDRVQQ